MSFRITGGKGFHIVFPNGYGVSVQFGPGNYGSNYDAPFTPYETALQDAGARGADKAEVAIFQESKKGLLEFPAELGGEGDTVCGYLDAEQVLRVMNWAAKQWEA